MGQYSNKKNRKAKHQPTKGTQINQRKKDLNSIKTLAEKNPIAARTELIRYLEEHPTDMYAVFYYGHLEEQLGNFDSAKTQFERVATSESNNKYSAIVRLGEIARKQGQLSLARKYYHQAIAESPNEERYALCILAKLERIAKNYNESLRYLRMVKVQDEQIKLEIIKTLSLQGNIAEAMEMLKNLNPKTEEQKRAVSLEKGKIARRQNDVVGAKYHLGMVLCSGDKNDLYYRAMYELAHIGLEEGEYQTAINYCEELTVAEEDFDKDVYLLLGLCQEKAEIYDKALKNYQTATSSLDHDTRVSAYYYLGSMQYTMGDYDAAIQSLLKSTEGDKFPPTSTIMKLIGMYLKQGKYEEMAACIEHFRNNNPAEYALAGLEPACILLAQAIGKPIQKREAYKNYGERQIAEYRRNEALEHIRARHATGKSTQSCFSREIDVEELFDDIKSQMVPDNKVNADSMDLYEIDYSYAGYDQENNLVHRIRVVAIPNTHNILTMYPSNKGDIPRQSDITKQIEAQATSGNSQIAKFNRRFANPSKK